MGMPVIYWEIKLKIVRIEKEKRKLVVYNFNK